MKPLSDLQQKFVAVMDSNEWTVEAVRQKAGASFSTGTPIMNQLEELGLLTSRKEGRFRYVKLTRRGRKLCRILKQIK